MFIFRSNLLLCLASILTFNQISAKQINKNNVEVDLNLINKRNIISNNGSNNNKNIIIDSFSYIQQKTHNQNHHRSYGLHKHHKLYNRLKKSETKDSESEDLVVQTQSGRIRGVSFKVDEHLENKSNPSRIDAWLGIPFAEKPIGNLRFKRPIPIKSWDDVLNTTELPNTCYQLRDMVFENFPGAEMWNPNTDVSEDCLYLNIWVPHPRPRNAAVMVGFIFLN